MARSDKGKTKLTDRDIRALIWTGEQYAVRMDTMQRLLKQWMWKEGTKEPMLGDELELSNARRVVRRWEKKDKPLVNKQIIKHGGHAWIWLTSEGLRMFDFSYQEREPALSLLQHYHVVNEVRLFLEDSINDMGWVPERELRREWHSLPPKQREHEHLADGVVIVNGQRIAVEVELNQKTKPRYKDIRQELLHQYDGVYYFVNEKSMKVVQDQFGHSDFFKIYQLENLLESGYHRLEGALN